MDPEQATRAGWLAELRGIDTAVIGDVLDEFGRPNQVLSRSIGAIGAVARVAGFASCAALVPKRSLPGQAYDDFSSVDRLAAPGNLVVIACAGSEGGAVLGEFMAREFQRRGAEGVVTNGAVRDVAVIDRLQFPVHAGGASPMNGARRLAIASTDQPVELPGEGKCAVRIAPGDILVGDRDGVVVIPAAIAAVTVQASLLYAGVERKVVEAMAGGMSRVEALKTHNRGAAVRPLKPA